MKTSRTYTVLEEQLTDKNVRKHAGGKAREDLHTILLSCGVSELVIRCPQNERISADPIRKITYHYQVARKWKKTLSRLNRGDMLILQFPVINHTFFLNNTIKTAKRRGITVCAFIHDLEILRRSKDERVTKAMRWRLQKEEVDELQEFDIVVVHNERMKAYIIDQFKLDEERVRVLGIFDYLIPSDFEPASKSDAYDSCIIAGNLSRKKSEYIYHLPDSPGFELYGVEYENDEAGDNVHYHGSFLPEDLPFNLTGGFGLVWDGTSADTCSGIWGEYLRYNNPHKTSLYLACGIPVIIWKEAALADFILKYDAGITVGSLGEIKDAVSALSPERYEQLRKNAIEVGKQIRNGENTKRVLRELGVI